MELISVHPRDVAYGQLNPSTYKGHNFLSSKSSFNPGYLYESPITNENEWFNEIDFQRHRSNNGFHLKTIVLFLQ